MLKSNSNKMMLCWGGGQHYLVLNKILTKYFHYNFLSELNNISHVKDSIRFTCCAKLIDDRRRPNKKNIKSLDLTQKVLFLGFDFEKLNFRMINENKYMMLTRSF